jgi:hypothetical protein
MLDGLDSIPWQQLTHAYGSAEDVPGLLRASLSANEGAGQEDSPLWCLFGNIWHQGTVYEATAYAVPFLIELAENQQTPNRVDILLLLAAIARGNSYLAVHGNILKESDFAAKKTSELEWAAKAHAAVESGFDAFVAMTEEEPQVRLASAHVLAQLQERGELVSTLLQRLLSVETDSLRRAGLLLLLGQAGNRSETMLPILNISLAGADVRQRRAATFAMACLNPQPLPKLAREAVLEAIASDDLEELFLGLPWDVSGEIHREDLYTCLDDASKNEVAEKFIAAIESGNATDATVSTVLDLLFRFAPVAERSPLKASDLNPLQARAVRSMAKAMEGGRRIFYGAFPQWGLPDTVREWNELAAQTHRG